MISGDEYMGIFGPKRDEVTGDWRKLHTWDMSDKYTTYPQLVPGLRIHGA
jgi:hypothetical protein